MLWCMRTMGLLSSFRLDDVRVVSPMNTKLTLYKPQLLLNYAVWFTQTRSYHTLQCSLRVCRYDFLKLCPLPRGPVFLSDCGAGTGYSAFVVECTFMVLPSAECSSRWRLMILILYDVCQ
jgi:hypothetical protein